MWNGLSLLAATEFGSMLKRNLRAITYYVASALIAGIALVFLLQATHSWLVLHMSTIWASLLIAAVMLLFAGLLLLIGHDAGKRKSAPSPLASTALVAVPFAARMIGKRISLGTVAVAGVVAIGVVLGRLIAKD
jgi:hypothetical protein